MALKKEPSAEGSDSSVEISEEVTSSQQNILKKAMLSDREMEYQFWENFPSLDSTSKEDDSSKNSCDTITDLSNSYSHKQKRLSHRDMSLYGQAMDLNFFTLVTCYACGMILKPQAFDEHLKKRHSFDSLSDDTKMNVALHEQIQPMLKAQRELQYRPQTEHRTDQQVDKQKHHPVDHQMSLKGKPPNQLSRPQIKPQSKPQNKPQSGPPIRPQSKPHFKPLVDHHQHVTVNKFHEDSHQAKRSKIDYKPSPNMELFPLGPSKAEVLQRTKVLLKAKSLPSLPIPSKVLLNGSGRVLINESKTLKPQQDHSYPQKFRTGNPQQVTIAKNLQRPLQLPRRSPPSVGKVLQIPKEYREVHHVPESIPRAQSFHHLPRHQSIAAVAHPMIRAEKSESRIKMTLKKVEGEEWSIVTA